MSALSLRDVETATNALPGLPTVVLEVMRTIDAGQAEVNVLQRLISKDQGLAARILQIANSPFYGMSGQIDTVKDACILLGINTLRHLTLACGVMDRFPVDAGGDFDRASLWHHAVAVGMAARALAAQCRHDPDQAFTAGLLHDLGKLALDSCFPVQYAAVARYCVAHDCSLSTAENALLGFDHSNVGARLAVRWCLPPATCAAIGGHHAPDLAPATLTDLVHLADVLCRGLGVGDAGDSLVPPLSAAALQRLGVQWEQLDAIFADIERLNATSALRV